MRRPSGNRPTGRQRVLYGEITGESTVRALGEPWLAEIDHAVWLGKRSPTNARDGAADR